MIRATNRQHLSTAQSKVTLFLCYISVGSSPDIFSAQRMALNYNKKIDLTPSLHEYFELDHRVIKMCLCPKKKFSKVVCLVVLYPNMSFFPGLVLLFNGAKAQVAIEDALYHYELVNQMSWAPNGLREIIVLSDPVHDSIPNHSIKPDVTRNTGQRSSQDFRLITRLLATNDRITGNGSSQRDPFSIIKYSISFRFYLCWQDEVSDLFLSLFSPSPGIYIFLSNSRLWTVKLSVFYQLTHGSFFSFTRTSFGIYRSVFLFLFVCLSVCLSVCPSACLFV